MVFYKIEAKLVLNENEELDMSRDARYELAGEIAEKTESLFNKSEQENYIFVSHIRFGNVVMGAVLKNGYDINKLFNEFRKSLSIKLKQHQIEEVTFNTFTNLLASADNNDYIDDDEKVLTFFEIDGINPRYNRCDYGESMINSNLSREENYNIAEDLLFGETLTPELDRIYAQKGGKTFGHPVHYILKVDNRDVRKTIYKTLLSALYSNKRLQNKRYCFVDYNEQSRIPGAQFEALYKSCSGGAVIIRYIGEDDGECDYANRGNEVIKNLCEIAMKYKNKVLTVICVSRSSDNIKETFLSNCADTSFIELYEDVVYGERATAYLKARAKEYKIRADKNLTDFLRKDDCGYTAQNLNDIFDKWYDKKLRNTIYPQYKTTVPAKATIQQEKPKGTAYDRLQELIGLGSAKKVMEGALNYFKAQKVFADRGVIAERPAMHMIFTGNPGTAKTTVARLFAQIMKENGLLSKGEILELGRADLVGKYVGWTAQCVKDAFKKAKGGVLFIDEAYSLVDDRSGSFGDEAINTIVQEMENNRLDTVVIFAGYPNEMEGFLNKNPGLSSRIAFHIPFEDYTASELCDISALIAKDKGLKLDGGAMQKLNGLFDTARQKSDFGNGRYARNIIEKAKMAQANRLIKMDLEKITDDDLFTICAEDIELPQSASKERIVKIGFCA